MGLINNKQRIFVKLAEGKSREDIFNEFSEGSPDEQSKIASAIASIPTAELRKKYHLPNLLLFCLLVSYSFLALTAAFPVQGGMDYFILVLKAAIPIFFSYYIYYFHGGLYRFLALWGVIELVEVLFRQPTFNIFTYSKALVLLLILFITALICFKVFPHFGFLNPKQNANGKYYLE